MTNSNKSVKWTSQKKDDYPFDFTVVVPCFNEESSIGEFNERLINTLERSEHCFEIIYVNDGSEDNTLNCLLNMYKNNDIPVTILDLVQNVGQTNAITAGYEYAKGKDIIFLDCDLQIAPEDLLLLLDVFDEKYDMVCGARMKRKDNLLRVYVSRMGNTVLRYMLGLPMYDFGSGMRIVNGAFARAFNCGPFRPINPGALMLSLRHMTEVKIEHHARKSGRTKWTIRRFIALYHNIFKNLIPFIYMFAVAPLFLFSLLLLLYFFLAVFYPSTFPFSEKPVLLPLLITFSIVLNFANFLILAEFVLRGNTQLQEPAYIIRNVFVSWEE